MIDVIAIDPGVWALGWCAGGARTVRRAGCSKVPRSTGFDTGTLVTVHTNQISQAILDEINPSAIVYAESMELRPSDGLAVARDLMRVQSVGVGVGARFDVGLNLIPVSTWKGSVPKSVHHPRILAALDVNERRIVDAACKAAGKANTKEVLDAVGIFLYSVGRIDKAGAPRT